jgi:hypothetical protein
VREDIVGSPIQEDLKAWRHSGLGRRLVEGDQDTLEEMKISKTQAREIRSFLTASNGSS